MKVAIKFLKIFALLLLVSPLLCFWGLLAWIAYWPVPRVPRLAVQYSVGDMGKADVTYPNFYGGPQQWRARLTDTGEVVHLGKAAQEKDEARRKAAEAAFARRLRLPETSVAAMSRSGHALLYEDGLRLWRDGKFAAAIPRRVRGYSWKKMLFLGFYTLNGHDIAIGNARIGTGFASSGGLTSPHGRSMPLVWHGNPEPPEDLNSRIGSACGWYLDAAADLDERGQILCMGRRADERGAEDSPQDEHWLVLTPVKQ